jgi:hypothetical protein
MQLLTRYGGPVCKDAKTQNLERLILYHTKFTTADNGLAKMKDDITYEWYLEESTAGCDS